jgi:hypothetical protein
VRGHDASFPAAGTDHGEDVPIPTPAQANRESDLETIYSQLRDISTAMRGGRSDNHILFPAHLGFGRFKDFGEPAGMWDGACNAATQELMLHLDDRAAQAWAIGLQLSGKRTKIQ